MVTSEAAIGDRTHSRDGYGTLDAIDWQIVAIEAERGYAPLAATHEAMAAAARVFDDPDVTVDDVIPAARAVLALLRCYLPDTHEG